MHNALINRKLKMGHNSTFDQKLSQNHQNFTKNDFWELKKKINAQRVTNNKRADIRDNLKDFQNSKQQNKDQSLSQHLFFSQRNQQKGKSFYIQSDSFYPLIRNKKNAKEQLKPKSNSAQLKQIQSKIFYLQKFRNQSQFRDDAGNKKSNRKFLQNFKLQKMLQSGQIKSLEQNKESQEQKDKGQWYMRAIQTHFKQNVQKINLNYCIPQHKDFSSKTVINEKQLGKTLYQKMYTGFKKRAASYEIKYI